MTEIVRTNKDTVTVKVNNIQFKIENKDVREQLAFMEQVVPKDKPTFYFAQFFEPIPTLGE